MATLQKRQNKHGGIAWAIQLYIRGARKTVSFPSSVTRREAEDARRAVEILQDAAASDRPLTWRESQTIEALPDIVTRKFECLGLLASRERLTIAEVWDRWLSAAEAGDDYTPNTLSGYRQARRVCLEYFAGDEQSDDITCADAVAWRAWQLDKKLARATVATHIKRVKTVWRWAVSSGLCATNPFADVVAGSQMNKEREFYVSRDTYRRLLDACPDQTWRCMIALARLGCLRCPSEVLAITWQDVDWSRGRLRVVSNKQRKHEDKYTRVIPLWLELRAQLSRQFEEAEPGGSPFVITKYRNTAANLRTGLERIIFLAGLLQWPRLWQNLRASRCNEIWREYPPHLAEYWTNQTSKVACRHYLHATDEDYSRALASEQPASEDGETLSKAAALTLKS